jgi:hypothetical protein
MVGMPAVGDAHAHQGQGKIEIIVSVVPGPASQTLSATLVGAPGAVPAAQPMEAASFDLLVVDNRGSFGGWRVQVAQDPAVADPLWLTHYRQRAEHLAGQPLDETGGPRARRLAIGQPLSRLTPVFVAAPGPGAGVYRVQCAVGAAPETGIERQHLIVALPSAP